MPDQRKKYSELGRKKKRVVDEWFKSMLTNHFSILNPDVESDGDPLVIADGLRVVEFVLIYGIIGGEFLRPLLQGVTDIKAQRNEEDRQAGRPEKEEPGVAKKNRYTRDIPIEQ